MTGVRVVRPKLGPATPLLAGETRPQKPPTLPPPILGMGNELVVDAGSRSLGVSRSSNLDVAEANSNGHLHREAFEDVGPLEKNLDRAVLVHQAIHNGPRLQLVRKHV